MALTKELTNHSLPEIGEAFNGRDHTTVLHACKKILELRNKAETALGDQFDIRGFHDAVLGGGAMPLPILERVVDQWIDSVRTNAAS